MSVHIRVFYYGTQLIIGHNEATRSNAVAKCTKALSFSRFCLKEECLGDAFECEDGKMPRGLGVEGLSLVPWPSPQVDARQPP